MPRKSKKIEQNKSLQENNNIEVIGNVNIKIKQGNKIIKNMSIHNSGTLNLFYGLTLALTGSTSYSNDSYLPKYICAGTGTCSESEAITLDNLKSPIDMNMPPITLFTSPIKDTINKLATVTFQGIIPYRSVGQAQITELGIYGVNGINSGTLISRVQFNQISLERGQSLYIEWTYGIKNLTIDSTTTTPNSPASL